MEVQREQQQPGQQQKQQEPSYTKTELVKFLLQEAAQENHKAPKLRQAAFMLAKMRPTTTVKEELEQVKEELKPAKEKLKPAKEALLEPETPCLQPQKPGCLPPQPEPPCLPPLKREQRRGHSTKPGCLPPQKRSRSWSPKSNSRSPIRRRAKVEVKKK